MSCMSRQHSSTTSTQLAADNRADHGTRKVTLGPDAIRIERVLQGIKMRIHVPAQSYAGVRLAASETQSEAYEISLAHRDPELSVLLASVTDASEAEDLRRKWSAFFARGESNGISGSTPRRRCMTQIEKRRPRRLARRKLINRENLSTVRRGEREIISYE